VSQTMVLMEVTARSTAVTDTVGMVDVFVMMNAAAMQVARRRIVNTVLAAVVNLFV